MKSESQSRFRRSVRRTGVLLIGVMLTTLLVAMFIGASLSLSPSSLGRSQKDEDLQSAQNAAVSGIEYALARLRQDPTWRAKATRVITTPELVVHEGNGNVVGLLHTGEGSYAQFRLRMNWENGTPIGDPDQQNNSAAPMTVDFPVISQNNVDQAMDFPMPATGGRPALIIPAHSAYLAVQGRCGPACSVLSGTDFNAALPNFGCSTSVVRSVYRLSNPGQTAPPGVAMSSGDLTAEFPPGSNEILHLNGQAGKPPNLRSKSNLNVIHGNSTNDVDANVQGQLRLPSGATPNSNGQLNLTRETENPGDAFYQLGWSDVRKADGTHTLAAGTYVWSDDGRLHYYDMSSQDYIQHATVNPADEGTILYSNTEGVKAIAPGVNVTSSGTGSSMTAEIRVHKDTQVTPVGTNSELAILPRKGAAEKPASGTGTGTATQFMTTLDAASVLTAGGGSNQYNLSTNSGVVSFFDGLATWGASNGYGSYVGVNWTLQGASTLQVSAGGVANLPPGQIPRLQDAFNAYVAANPSVLATLPLGGQSFVGGTSDGTVSGSTDQVDPNKIQLTIQPDGGSSAVLSGEGSITVGAKLKGQGASIVAGEDVRLVGLGVDLTSNPNATEGVSLYARRDIFISTFDKTHGDFKDVGLNGVVYAWGGVEALLGDGSLSGSHWGKFRLNGALVSYGGDPGSGTMDPSRGRIRLKAGTTQLDFEPSYLATLMNSLPANMQFGRTLWVVE